MRVLIVTQYFWPEDFRINDLALGLKARGCDVSVLTGKPNYPGGALFKGYGFFRPFFEKYQEIPVWRAPLVTRGQSKGLRLALNYLSFALFASLLAPIFCRSRYDAIFVYQPSPITVALPAILLRRIKRAPLMLWVQDLWPESLAATGAIHSKLILAWLERLVRFIYKRCDRILIQSRSFAEPIRQKNVLSDKLLYFPNSAETLYRPVVVSDEAPERKLMPLGFRVMFAGNIGAAQDFDTILTAASQLKHEKNIHWVILGDGRCQDWVAEQIKTRGLGKQVHMFGRFPPETMPRFFALADVLLVTLRREPIFALTIPGKVQSYLACAKPIVAALDGEGKRVIEESGAGLTVSSGDAPALTNAVLKMYQFSPDMRRTMGERGKAYFERHFAREHLLDQLMQWIEK